MASAATRTLLAADVWASSADGATNRQTPEALGHHPHDRLWPPIPAGRLAASTRLDGLTNQRYHEIGAWAAA